MLAIQVHNAEPWSTDLTIIPFLTFMMSQPPDNPRGKAPEVNFQNSKFHSNFKLDGSGESVFLTDSDGNIIDSITFGMIIPDISFGRLPGEPGTWTLFTDVTPGTENAAVGVKQLASDHITFFPDAGIFSGTEEVLLSIDEPE